ncbi:MAG: ATPase [Aquimarina sp.]|nr:ATPase [Aquimarina sp.]
MRTYPQTLDIPEIDQIPNFMKILDDLSVGNNVFLKGIAGTGKTTLGEKVAYAHFGRRENDKKELPFIIISCNQYTSPIDIKGGQTMYGYKEGGLIEAWRDGKILIIDEMPKLDPNTAGLLNDPLAKSAKEGAIIFNGLNEPVVKHPDFGCIATGNVTGKAVSSTYVGNNRQDSSLLDRFSGSIYEIGFNEKLERSLVYPPLVDICIAIRSSILKYEGKDNTAGDMEDIMTLRTMLNFQRIYIQEMLRQTGVTNTSKKISKPVRNGKTLKDCLESYFLVMNREKAAHIRREVNLEEFLNRYKGAEMKQVFIHEYKRRNGLLTL